MEKVNIGGTALDVARINLGGNVFGWTLSEEQSFEILDACGNSRPPLLANFSSHE